MKYSDQIALWLVNEGYTTCYFVGGGNIMHLTESLSNHLEMVPVIHEVAAVIAAEYQNEIERKTTALALVTAGPGLTNTVTGLAGAYLESRKVLVIGGQVKTTDLADRKLRQRGIQELHGAELVKSVTNTSNRLDSLVDHDTFVKLITYSECERGGPIFLEIPLDLQAAKFEAQDTVENQVSCFKERSIDTADGMDSDELLSLQQLLDESEKPVILIGGGVSQVSAYKLEEYAIKHDIPVATTWNGADRIGSESHVYIGRPNTWGQRYSNILVQQADLLLAVGTRLGMQQTGFNYNEFLKNGKIVQVDIDKFELDKGHPTIKMPLNVSSEYFANKLSELQTNKKTSWLAYCKQIRQQIPLFENGINFESEEYIMPQRFMYEISESLNADDYIIPCSSGSAFTTSMQYLRQKSGQRIVTNKGLASMGYGLSGSIGAAKSKNAKRVILFEGDGGFAQNIQELGTVRQQNLNLKIFIFDDSGHASIRMTQKNYFNGKYVGCDKNTNLGLPDWDKVGDIWDIPTIVLNKHSDLESSIFKDAMSAVGPFIFVLKISLDQTYLPKITSRVTENGSMVSNPIDQMTPEISYARYSD